MHTAALRWVGQGPPCAPRKCLVLSSQVQRQLSEVLNGVRWPMFVVATYALAPFPIFVFGKNEDGGTATYWAYFTAGWILAASFGIPCILAHSSVIAVGNAFFSLFASLLVYGSVLGISWWQARENSSGFRS